MKSKALKIVTICGVFLVPEKEPNMSEIRFSSKEHEKFFYQMLAKCGKHGLFVVQNLENIMGPPGLTAILFFVAVAFLT